MMKHVEFYNTEQPTCPFLMHAHTHCNPRQIACVSYYHGLAGQKIHLVPNMHKHRNMVRLITVIKL